MAAGGRGGGRGSDGAERHRYRVSLICAPILVLVVGAPDAVRLAVLVSLPLNVSVLCAVAARACGRHVHWLAKPIGTVFTGAASGAMNVVGSNAGPVAALYASNAGWPAATTTATLQAYFAALNVVTLLTLGLPHHTVLLAPAFAGLVLGLAAGLPLGSRIPTSAAHRTVLALAAAGGCRSSSRPPCDNTPVAGTRERKGRMPVIEHRGRRPRIHPRAYIAPTATISGEVSIGADARVLYGAVITAEDAMVTLDERVVIMENALVRGRGRHPTVIGQDVLVGPHAHLNGTRVERDCFLATGCCLFPGSLLGAGTEVRIHGVVHVNTHLPPDSLVPIGWIALGNPASILSPDRHDDIWAVQRQLDFPGTVYGISRDAPTQQRMAQQTAWFGAHQDDQIVDDIRTS